MTKSPQRFFTPFKANIRTPNDADLSTHQRALEKLGLPDDEGRVIPVLISTNKTARDGHRIFDWTVEHYTQRNPVILWGHDRDAPAIGRSPVVTWNRENGELRALAQFTSRDLNPFGYRIGEMVAAGYLNQPSVGWETLRYERETDPEILEVYPRALRINLAELLEFSVVNVEADTATGFGRAIEMARADSMELTELVAFAERAIDENQRYHIPRPVLEDLARNGSRQTISCPSYCQPRNHQSPACSCAPGCDRCREGCKCGDKTPTSTESTENMTEEQIRSLVANAVTEALNGVREGHDAHEDEEQPRERTLDDLAEMLNGLAVAVHDLQDMVQAMAPSKEPEDEEEDEEEERDNNSEDAIAAAQRKFAQLFN